MPSCKLYASAFVVPIFTPAPTTNRHPSLEKQPRSSSVWEKNISFKWLRTLRIGNLQKSTSCKAENGAVKLALGLDKGLNRRLLQ